MSSLLELLKPEFLLHHAVYGSLAVGFVCPLVGVYFLLRRLVFWGVALPQVSAAGIAFVFMLSGFGWSPLPEKRMALLGALVFTIAAVLVLTALERRGKEASEGRVGALYALAGAATILFVAFNAAGETEMMGLLKGEIVSISERDFHLMLDLFGAASVLLLVFQREFLLVSYDRDMAVTLGRAAFGWDALLYLIIALSISLGVMTVGPLVIFGYLVIPPMAALPWARGMMSLSLLASALGGLSAFAGFYLSYRFDLPLGPLVVAMAGAFLAISYLLRAIVRRRAA